MSAQTFKAMIVHETADGRFIQEIARKSLGDLPHSDLLISVKHSSLNYKDALSATGRKGVTKHYPHTPGIDAAGVVIESTSQQFTAGDEVIVTGFDLGMNTPGGFGECIRVPASWAVRLPEGMTLKESMAYGTAGLTAALSVSKMEKCGLKPDQGDMLVTGATGGVGSLAIGILAKAGYRVVAATGKLSEREYLFKLGAKEVVSRDSVNDASGKPLSKGRWAGVVDTVGGNILATAIKSTRYGGLVACCGLVASSELSTTIFPFILRGVSLLGIDSAECPIDTRLEMWNKISHEWRLDNTGVIASDCRLEDLSNKIEAMLQGKLRGRVVVNLN